ncbi:hypothetical protein ACWEF6_02840 [Amycolatopsis sp. NPDC004772]
MTDEIPRIGGEHRQPTAAVQYGVRLRSGQVVTCADRAAADEFLAACSTGGVLVQRSEWTDVEDIAAQLREERAVAEARPHDPEPCPAGECNQGMCGGTSDHNGPCGGCCGCLGGCLDFQHQAEARPRDDEPRPGDLVLVYSPTHKNGVGSTVDEHGNYDGKDVVDAGAARMTIFKRAGDRG